MPNRLIAKLFTALSVHLVRGGLLFALISEKTIALGGPHGSFINVTIKALASVLPWHSY